MLDIYSLYYNYTHKSTIKIIAIFYFNKHINADAY